MSRELLAARRRLHSGWLLKEPEVAALCGPVERNVPAHQIGKREPSRLSTINYGARDVGRKIGQSDQCAYVRSRTAVFAGELVQRRAVLKALAQIACPG